MTYETVRYSVPTGSRDACREATCELVERTRNTMEEKVRSYLVLEGGNDERSTYLHLAMFEDVDAKKAFEESEAFRMFRDLVYPATIDGIEFGDHDGLDRTPPLRTAIPQA